MQTECSQKTLGEHAQTEPSRYLPCVFSGNRVNSRNLLGAKGTRVPLYSLFKAWIFREYAYAQTMGQYADESSPPAKSSQKLTAVRGNPGRTGTPSRSRAKSCEVVRRTRAGDQEPHLLLCCWRQPPVGGNDLLLQSWRPNTCGRSKRRWEVHCPLHPWSGMSFWSQNWMAS